MSCNYCATQAASVLAMSNQQSQATFSRPGLETPRCPQCGAWYQPDAACLVCEREQGAALARAEKGTAHGDPALNEELVPAFVDLLSNEFMEQLYSNRVTASVGRPINVRLQDGDAVQFATDLKGNIVAHAYPVGKDAPPAHNIIVTEAGINHEQWHDEITPQEMWYDLVSISNTQQYDGPLNFDMAGQRVYERWGGGRRSRPPEQGEYVIQIDRLRPLVSQIGNIIEDGRIERWGSRHYPGAGEVLAASCRLEERWDKANALQDSPIGQLFGAMLYTSLPYYKLEPELEEKLDPMARAVFKEVGPIIMRAVDGSPDDVYQATLIVSDIIERSAILPERAEQPQNLRTTPPSGGGSAPPLTPPDQLPGYTEQQPTEQKSGGQQGRRGRKQQEDESRSNSRPQAQEEEEPGRRSRGQAQEESETREGPVAQGDQEVSSAGSGRQHEEGDAAVYSNPKDADDEGSRRKGDGRDQGDDATSSRNGREKGAASGAGGNQEKSRLDDEDEFEPLSDESLDVLADRMSKEAAGAIKRGVEEKYGDKALAAALHKPLTGKEYTRSQKYRDGEGVVRDTLVYTPRIPGLAKSVMSRAANRKRNARQIAKYLRAVRSEVERSLTNQTHGKLDRRRFVAAAKGQRNIRRHDENVIDTSLSVSLNLDMSGSMDEHVRENRVLDSFLDIGQALEMLDEGVEYEARAFASSTMIVKSMAEKTFDAGRVASLSKPTIVGYGTKGGETAGLSATSLRGAESRNRLMVLMTDGGFSDRGRMKSEIQSAQEEGVIVFGIYFLPRFSGQSSDDWNAREILARKPMEGLYGPGNYAIIQDLDEMPGRVGKRIARLFSKMRRR